MGVINITFRKESRQSLPSMSFDVGGVEAAMARMRGAQQIGAAASRLGDRITRFADDLASLRGRVDPESQKRKDRFKDMMQTGMSAYGNGTGGGSVNETFDRIYGGGGSKYNVGETGANGIAIEDGKAWKAKNDAFRNDYATALKDDLKLTDREYEEVQHQLNGFYITLDNSWSAKAHKADTDMNVAEKSANRKHSNDLVFTGECAPEAWQEWWRSQNEYCDALEIQRGYEMSKAERQGMLRDQAEKGCLTGVADRIDKINSEIAGNPELAEDSKAVGEDFDAIIDAWRKGLNLDSFLPESSWQEKPKYGMRADGKTYKGEGWLGAKQVKGGGVATEYTVQSDAVKVDGKRIDFPTLVPTLTDEEVTQMTEDIIPNHKEIPEPIMQKAIDHANARLAEGKSVFHDDGESGRNYLKEALKGVDETALKDTAIKMMRDAKQKAMNQADRLHSQNRQRQMDEDGNEFALAVKDQDKAGWQLPDLKTAFARIDGYKSLDEADRVTLKQKWQKMVDTRIQFDKDQKEKNGTPMKVIEKDQNGKEVERTVWISARVCPTKSTDIRIKEYTADNYRKTLDNPADALAFIEACKATGNASWDDYNAISKTAKTAMMSPEASRAMMNAGGGLFGELLLKKMEQKGALSEEDLEGLNLYYKKGRDKTHGYRGGYTTAMPNSMFSNYLTGATTDANDRAKASLWADISEYDGAGRGEYLLSIDERKLLLDKIEEYTRYGLKGEQLDKALETLFAPTVAKYYNMTMLERLRDEKLNDEIMSMSEVRTKAANYAGAMVHQPVKAIRNY